MGYDKYSDYRSLIRPILKGSNQMNVSVTHIKDKIKTLSAVVAQCPVTMDESKSALEAWQALPSFEDQFSTEGNALYELGRFAGRQNEIDMYEHTLTLNLMRVETKYVITNEPNLVSPSGFHPDEKVYVQTQIAIHTNTPTYSGRSVYWFSDQVNGTLYVHKMK
jgi:hypothetical protein